MKMLIQQKIQAGFAVALAFLLLTGATAWWSGQRNAEGFRRVDHTREVIDALQDTRAGLLNTETGNRGFAISGDEAFLQPYQAGIPAVQKSLAAAKRLTQDNPNQQRRLAMLEPLIQKKMSYLNECIKLRRSGDTAGALQFIASGKGDRMMDQISKLIAEMEAEEGQLLQRRMAKAQAASRATIAIVIFGSLLAVGLVALANVIVRHDFEKRQQAEAERDRFFTLSLDLLGIANTDGYFKRVNSAFTATLGWGAEEMLARPFIEFVHPDDRPATLREVEKLAAGQPTLQFENRYQCKNGSWKTLAWRARPQPDGTLYATGHDATDRKQAEEQIVQLNANLQYRAAQLEAANKELEAFSYSVSHDLRSPLRAVDGFSQAVLEDYGAQLPEEGRSYLQNIREGAQRMGVLIDDLLTFSRLSRLPLHKQAVNMTRLAREAFEDLNGQQKGREIDLRIGDLPSCEGDPALLKQVWVNLLSNAVKYTRKREAAVVDVGSREEKGENIYFVSDNGTGFDMQYAHKLFGVFQRLHRTDEFEGTGVGLAIVQRIVHRHGGRVWAEAAVERGATFHFTLEGEKENNV
jgi:PAS domain S-box-containing protein